jgi:hypothetical protein
MKKLSLLLFLFVFAFTACEKDEDMYTVLPADQATAPVLKAHDAMVVDGSNYNDNTVFSWTIADFGVPTATKYTLYASFGGGEPKPVVTTFGDSLSVRLLDICKVLYQSKITLDTPTAVQFHLVASIVDTYGTVKSNTITTKVTVGSDVPLYPENVYMIGAEFGNWNWGDAGIVEMTPINGTPGKFWAVRYFANPANGFKWCNVRDWKGDFFSLGTDVGFTAHDGNAFVSAAGFYIVVVDYTVNTITIEPAQVYGMGDSFGGYNKGNYPFTVAGTKMTITTTVADKELRMYVGSSFFGSDWDWWKTEFIILDGKIVYRGNSGDQERVKVGVGKVITLDFNAGTGTIE